MINTKDTYELIDIALGEEPFDANRFLEYFKEERRKGATEAEIARGLGIRTTKLRGLRYLAKKLSTKES